MQRILLVDDDGDFAEAVGAFLEANGFRVRKARDGREALRMAAMETPDLVIMDIVMNERTEGLFAIQEMRRSAALRNVPVFVLTSLYSALPEFQIAPDSAWMAHDEFFSKPVDPTELLARIRRRVPVQGDGG
jgi:DNA-binding response OmpR family regulator